MTAQTLTTQRRVLDIRNLSVSFGRGANAVHAVKGLSLHVDRAETLAIVGESGSGKSVTSLAIMRLVEFGGGQIHQGEMVFHRADGSQVDLRAAPEEAMRRMRGADLGMIFQEPMTSLNPVFTVGTQIIEAIQLHQDLNHEQAIAAAKRILDQVRISDSSAILGRYPHELSGGMRQRVMIAMALSCKPALLIADEPTTALDVTIQAQILQLIRELQKEMDMGVIFITHDMGVVAEVANRVMVMRHGKVVFGAAGHCNATVVPAAATGTAASPGSAAPPPNATPLLLELLSPPGGHMPWAMLRVTRVSLDSMRRMASVHRNSSSSVGVTLVG